MKKQDPDSKVVIFVILSPVQTVKSLPDRSSVLVSFCTSDFYQVCVYPWPTMLLEGTSLPLTYCCTEPVPNSRQWRSFLGLMMLWKALLNFVSNSTGARRRYYWLCTTLCLPKTGSALWRHPCICPYLRLVVLYEGTPNYNTLPA